MPFNSHSYRLENFPIIVFVNEGTLDGYVTSEASARVDAAITGNALEQVILIIDNSRLIYSSQEFSRVVRETQEDKGPGSPLDPRIKGGVMVGNASIFQVYTEFLGDQTDQHLMMQVVDTLEEAVEFAKRLASEIA